MIYLINPPLTKASEPHSGLAKLKGALNAANIDSRMLDFNLEAQLYVLARNQQNPGGENHQAVRRLKKNLQDLGQGQVFAQFPKYQRAVKEINRVLGQGSESVYLSLQNLEYPDLFPHRSVDLLKIYHEPQRDVFYDFYAQVLPQLLERDQPSLIGISMVYLNQALSAFGLLGYLRQNYPHIKIVMGGSLVACWKDLPGFAQLKDLCEFVSGPGEGPLLKASGRDENIRGLPDYQDVKDLPYFSPGFILPYSLSVGCFYKQCKFCPECIDPQPFVTQPFSHAKEELENLVSRYKPKLIHFIDNAISLAHLRGLAETDLQAPWYAYSRFLPELTDAGLVQNLAKNRCVMLQLGLESGNQEVLDRLNKQIKLNEAFQILKNLKQAGILTYVYLLFGTPYDGQKEAEETLNQIRKLAPYIDFLNLSIFYMPHEFVSDFKVEKNDFSQGDLSLYTDFVHPQGWDRRAVRDFLENKFKKVPEIKAILNRTPPFFTSNHAAFFHRSFF